MSDFLTPDDEAFFDAWGELLAMGVGPVLRVDMTGTMVVRLQGMNRLDEEGVNRAIAIARPHKERFLRELREYERGRT